KDGSWILTLEGLAAGPYTISASDGDGSQSATAAKPLNFDVAAPPPPPMPLAAAVINPINIEPDKPVTITGTWLVGVATGLSVAVNDTVSVLGKDFNLLTDTAGKWKLTEPADLAPGTYNVVVTQTSADGKTVQSSSSFEIAAPPPPPPKAAPPAAPTIESVKSDSDHPTIKGTWPVAAGNTLQVELDGVTHTLGKDFDLLSDASGKWTLTPTKPVVNGTYDVVAKVTAADGQSTLDAGKDELTVAVAPPPPAPAPEQPYDCEGTLAKIAAVFPIRFEFDHADLGDKYQQALNQYTALLSDARCAALKVQVVGHADYLGPESYNMGLSENRAKTVIDALTAAKVDAGRLSSNGLGSSKPLDPAHSNDARAKNRRVEFSIQK
ncbi:MAG: OmpA family protein, partial [Aestuariivirga sp.]